MRYRVILQPSVHKDMRRIPMFMLKKILVRLFELESNPFPVGVKPIHGYPLHRIRVGQYRVLYEVATEIRIISVIRIAHRKDAYKDL